MSRPVHVRAWLLTEGDLLASGNRVLSVQRNPVTGQVTLATSDGRRRVLYRDDRLIAVRLAADPKPRNGAVRAFLGGVRRRPRHDQARTQPDNTLRISRAVSYILRTSSYIGRRHDQDPGRRR